MKPYAEAYQEVMNYFSVTETNGLDAKSVLQNREKYGENTVKSNKKKSIWVKLFEALKEPMVIILLIAVSMTVGVNLVKYVNGYETEFIECIGIVFAIILTITITLVMEGKSERAFEMLNQIKEDIQVKVIREGNIQLINQSEVVVGDIVLVATGDKLVADGRLIEAFDLQVDESMLTGESHAIHKTTEACDRDTVIAERTNMLYSGSFIMAGNGKMLITEVGAATEFGKIAEGLSDSRGQTPLQEKLEALSKVIALIGAGIAILAFVLQVYALNGVYTLDNISEAFISSIVLIVASVPEGLSTIVAASLAINVIKLAQKNTLVKKMVACETIGSVNIICSDKTGTLTENKMKVVAVDEVLSENASLNPYIIKNIALNSTADLDIEDKSKFIGNPTEGALLVHIEEQDIGYHKLRENSEVVYRQPFSSETKKMSSIVKERAQHMVLTKGSPEIILDICQLTDEARQEIQLKMKKYQMKACRLIAFAHKKVEKVQVSCLNESQSLAETQLESEESHIACLESICEAGDMIYDGFAAINDPLRKESFEAAYRCREAGIELKMLTGDNKITAKAIAEDLQIIGKTDLVVEARELEEYDDKQLEAVLLRIRVIARSTPNIKMRVVKLLKKMGNVVAVTGDGINDAPALKQADIGIAMGKTGTEVSKEASDMILLDDSFSTIVKAVEWGRGLYDNFQRFIQFQLTVNVASVVVVLGALLLGFEVPFTPLQLLWINIIMDGPPALTLGLEPIQGDLMKRKPISRKASIVSKDMLKSIFRNGLVIAFICLLQRGYNFLGGSENEQATILFTLFTICQLFNAFNSRKLGYESLITYGLKNKKMMLVLILTFGLQILITQFGGTLFRTVPLSIVIWLKIVGMGMLVILVDELMRWLERKLSLAGK